MKGGVEIGQRFKKTGAAWTVWEVAAFRDLPDGPHARLRLVGDPRTEITISVAALAEGRVYRPAKSPITARPAA